MYKVQRNEQTFKDVRMQPCQREASALMFGLICSTLPRNPPLASCAGGNRQQWR